MASCYGIDFYRKNAKYSEPAPSGQEVSRVLSYLAKQNEGVEPERRIRRDWSRLGQGKTS